MTAPSRQQADPIAEPETGPSDEVLRQFVGYHVKRGADAIQSELGRALKPLDLRLLTYSALALIVTNPGLRQTDLATLMDMEPPNLVVLLDALQQRGLIRRKRDETDRRAYALVPTAAGKRRHADATRAIADSEAQMMHRLSPEQKATVVQAMTMIRAAYQESKR